MSIPFQTDIRTDDLVKHDYDRTIVFRAYQTFISAGFQVRIVRDGQDVENVLPELSLDKDEAIGLANFILEFFSE